MVNGQQWFIAHSHQLPDELFMYHNNNVSLYNYKNNNNNDLEQRFSNWGPRSKRGPRRGLKGTAKGQQKIIKIGEMQKIGEKQKKRKKRSSDNLS